MYRCSWRVQVLSGKLLWEENRFTLLDDVVFNSTSLRGDINTVSEVGEEEAPI